MKVACRFEQSDASAGEIAKSLVEHFLGADCQSARLELGKDAAEHRQGIAAGAKGRNDSSFRYCARPASQRALAGGRRRGG